MARNIVGQSKEIEVLPAVQPNIPEQVRPVDTGIPQSSFVPLGAATPQDLTVQGAELQEYKEPEKPAWWKAAFVVAPTARDWGNAIYEDLKFDPDPLYKPDADAQEFFNKYELQEADDVSYINGAKSYEEMQFRQQRVLEKRQDAEILNAHPVLGFGASMIDIDAAASFIPAAGQVVGASKIGRLTQRAANAAVGAGGAYMINQALEDGSTRSESDRNLDSLTFGLVGLFSPIKQQQKVLDAAIQNEMRNVMAESTAKADQLGSLGDVNIMGAEGKIPVSQPLDPRKSPVPDWVAGSKWAAKLQSSGDYLSYILKGREDNPLSKVLATVKTQGDNAAYASAPIQADLEFRLVGVEDAINNAARELYNTSPNKWFGRKDHTVAQYQVTEQFGQAMQRLDQHIVERLGEDLPVDMAYIHKMINATDQPEAIKKVMRSYVDSGFAETALKKAKATGLLDNLDDAAALHSRPTYMPVKHSFERMNNLLKSGNVTERQLFEFIGRQIQRMYPEMQEVAKAKLDAYTLGKNFFDNQRKTALGVTEVQTAGLTKDQIQSLLRQGGVPEDDVVRVAERVFKGTQDAGTGVAKPFRKRLSWDWNASFTGVDGGTYRLGDLVDGNAYMNLTDYTRTMSKRIGLAQYGFKTTADLDAAITKALEDLPPDVPLDEAVDFMKNLRATALGHPVGEAVPETIRSLNTVAGSMLLSNSGLYNFVDLVTQVAKLGLLRTLPEIKNGMRNAFTSLKGVDKRGAEQLYDVLTGRLSTDGRWRNITTRYGDAFEVSHGVHESIQYYGQATRFVNLSEYVKRFQIGLIGGIFTSAFEGASKGVAKDINYLRNTLKMPDELIGKISDQYRTYGATVDLWDNEVRMAMEQKVFFESDNLAHTIRSGEIPSWIEYSTFGKAIFPFMSFAFAMQQKVLRNTYQRDGAAGIALLAAVQLPTAVMVAAVKNVKNGKDPEEDLAKGAVTAMSMLGSFSYPLEIIMNGGLNSSSAALAPVANAMSLGQKLSNGEVDLRSIKNATPLGSMTGLDFFITAIEGD